MRKLRTNGSKRISDFYALPGPGFQGDAGAEENPYYMWVEEVRFASDSPLEGARFELSVPRPRLHLAGYRSKAAKTALSPFI